MLPVSSEDKPPLCDGTYRDCVTESGQNTPFNQDKNNECRFIDNQYYKGFIDGCIDAGNTKEICEYFTDE